MNKLEEQIKNSLDSNAQSLDADTKKRLLEIRLHALETPSKRTWFDMTDFVPMAGLAFCCIVVVSLILPSNNPHDLSPRTVNTQELAIMLELIDNPEELDMLTDPGFYVWMSEVENESIELNAV